MAAECIACGITIPDTYISPFNHGQCVSCDAQDQYTLGNTQFAVDHNLTKCPGCGAMLPTTAVSPLNGRCPVCDPNVAIANSPVPFSLLPHTDSTDLIATVGNNVQIRRATIANMFLVYVLVPATYYYRDCFVWECYGYEDSPESLEDSILLAIGCATINHKCGGQPHNGYEE